ncbi:LuxR C-terminal-related transcriptional regulator [Paraeggerthella hominis]|uniref:helix-turn-helix domain-containing protein n=1 Tax=Paraeggerthella hominis TaxID=2897351 RepID=UPI003D0C5CF4
MRERSRGKATHSTRASVHPFVLSVAVVVGFGLYRGVNSSAYLSAFAFVKSPFLFVPDLFFNVVVACSVVVCASIAVLLALTGRLKAFSMPYVLPTVLLIVANAAALAGVVFSLPADMALLIPGVLYGAGSVMFSLFWIEVFSAQKPSAIVTQIALGMLLNVVVSATLTPLDPDVQMKLSCALLLVAATCAWFVRRALLDACAKEASHADAGDGTGDARACEQGEGAPACVNADAGAGAGASAGGQDKASFRARFAAYRDAFLELGDSVVAFFVLEAVIGLLSSFMLTGSLDFEGSGKVSSGAIVGAIIVFCFVVFVMHRMPKVSTVSRVIMPVLAAMLVFLPFLSEMYNLVFYMLLLGSYYFVALLITYLVAEVAHVRRVSPYVLMGVTMGVARVFLAVALLGGFAAAVAGGGPSDEGEHTMRFLVIIVVVLYALCMALVFFSRDRKRRREGAGQDGPGVDGALAAAQADAAATQADAASEGERALESRCAAVAREGGLTEREAEVLVYLARGRTKAYIAEALFVTENTVRSHVRNIYSKLGIHTRQQLIDLVESPRL